MRRYGVADATERDRRIAATTKQIADLREAARQGFLNSGRSKLPADALVAFWLEPAKRNDDQKKLVEKHAKQFDEEAAAAA